MSRSSGRGNSVTLFDKEKWKFMRQESPSKEGKTWMYRKVA